MLEMGVVNSTTTGDALSASYLVAAVCTTEVCSSASQVTNDREGFIVGTKHLLLLGDSGLGEGQRSG